MNNTLYIVIPCYNEEEALPQTTAVISTKLRDLTVQGKISERSKILLVDDGSRDGTWKLIASLCSARPEFCGVKLSRNRGTQNAIMAGMDAARPFADMIITTDADLQDDVGAVDRMVDAFLDGADVVYGVRSKRERDSFIKRFTAEAFYRVMGALGCETVFNHSDYRLLSRRALDALTEYGEREIFIRGVVPMLGFNSAVVMYERGERNAGQTKYTFGKLMALAANGITSHSMRPLRLIVGAGVLMLFASLIFFVGLIIALATGSEAVAETAILFSVWFVGGLITAAVGVVGEYVGRSYAETKGRPRYHIEAVINTGEMGFGK